MQPLVPNQADARLQGRCRRDWRRALPLILVLIVAGFALPAGAAIETWDGSSSSDWSDKHNWTPQADPSDDSVIITNATAFSILYGSAVGSNTNNTSLLFIQTSGRTNTLTVNYRLNLSNFVQLIGSSGSVAITLTNGTNSILTTAGQLMLSNAPTAHSLIVVGSGARLQANSLWLGGVITNGGSSIFGSGFIQSGGVFTQSAGSLSVLSAMTNGGNVFLSGGNAAAARWINTGAGQLQLLGAAVSMSVLSNSATFLQTAGSLNTLSASNRGTWTFSGGTASITNLFNLTNGIFNAGGGNLASSNLFNFTGASFNLSAGSLTATNLNNQGQFIIGTAALTASLATNFGSWSVQGGTNTFGSFFNVSTGAVTVSGGRFNAANLINQSSFIATNNTTVNAVLFTNSGSFVLNGSTILASEVRNSGILRGSGLINPALYNTGIVTNNTGGKLAFGGSVSNLAAASIFGTAASTLSFTGSMVNAGLTRVSDGSQANFSGAVSNAVGGVIEAKNQSRLRFDGGVTTLGGIALNASTAIFSGPLVLGSSGSLSAADTNSTFIVRGDMLNQSRNNNGFNVTNANVIVGGTTPVTGPGASTNRFEAASADLHTAPMSYDYSGFSNNFAYGRLTVTNNVSFVNLFDNGGGTNEAIYIDILSLYNGAQVRIDGLNVYIGHNLVDGDRTFSGDLGVGGIITADNAKDLGMPDLSLVNGGRLIFVPEPGSASLLGIGLAFAGWSLWRRQRRNK